MAERASLDLTADQLDALIGKAGGHDQILRILAGELEIRLLPAGGDQTVAAPTAIDRFVTVPAGLEFEERVRRGDYGWRNGDLTERRFPVTGDQVGATEQRLFHFARSISSQEAIWRIRQEGFEPARIGDILAFGEAFPREQLRYPVIGLGSVVEIDLKLSVPALWFDGDRRTLDLIWYDGDWHRNYRFLGVRRRPVA